MKKIYLLLSFILFSSILLTFFGSKIDSKTDETVDEWKITQYGLRDINSSFYILHNPSKGLIVVDGGWTDDASFVKEVIGTYGCEVEAWILTHPHQDHIGAFNELYNNLGNITVKSIYTVDMASPNECLEITPWDSIDAYQVFLSLNVSNIKYVYPGDTLEICGLTFSIFSAFDDNVRAYSRDYLNDGSMMFKVTNQEESMLFCADVGSSMSDYLVSKWGDELKSDYIQMGHHGYGGLSDGFYQAVCPKVAFFDAPDWLMFDETGRYDNPENAELMKNMGCEIYSFSTSPNTIILK